MAPGAAMLLLITSLACAEVPMTATALFESTVLLDYAEQKDCDVPRGGLPAAKIIRAHIEAIPVACKPWFGDDASMWYVMLALLDSESGGHMDKVSVTKEQTYGPYCGSVAEVRMLCAEFRWIPCPRKDWQIRHRLQTDPHWSALVAAGTLYRMTRMQNGDRMLGLLSYKMGGAGLRRAQEYWEKRGKTVLDGPSALSWRGRLNRVYCLRDHILMGEHPRPCQCKNVP